MAFIRQRMMYQGDPDHTFDYARSYGMYQGDPRSTRTRRGTITRGSTRAARAHSVRGTTSARPHKPGLPSAVADRLAGAVAGLRGGNIQAAIGQALLGTGKKAGKEEGKHRRSMNMANVKALRRGIRRIEGFEKIVHRIQRAYPRLARAAQHRGFQVHHRTRHAFGRKK